MLFQIKNLIIKNIKNNFPIINSMLEKNKFSKFFNKIPGMNAMSIMHDKWTDSNVGLFGGVLTNTPLLELSIFPAIPITYADLIVGGTLNDLGIDYTSGKNLGNLLNYSDVLKEFEDLNISNDDLINNQSKFLINQLRELNESR